MFWVLLVVLLAWLGPATLVAVVAGRESGKFTERLFKSLIWWPVGALWAFLTNGPSD